MARMPTIGLQPRRGEGPSTAVVQPTDLGLGRVAQDVETWERERDETQQLAEQDQAERDAEYAAGEVEALQSSWEPVFGEMGAGWQGEGFGPAALAAFDTATGPVRLGDGTRTPGQQAAVERQLDTYRTATGQRAIRFETERRAGVIAEQNRAADAAALSQHVIGFYSTFGPLQNELQMAFDGSSPGYETSVMQAFDQAYREALQGDGEEREGVPERLRPAFESRMASVRLQVFGEAQAVRDRTHAAVLANQAEASSNGLINSVLVSPGLYDTALSEIPALLSGLPVADRPAAERALQGQIAGARLSGLINQGEFDQAEAEILDGRYNTILDPGMTQRLLGQIETGREQSPAAIVERLEMADLIDSTVASIAETGEAPEAYSLEEVARVLGPDGAARAARQVEQARALYGDLGGWSDLSLPEIRERVEAIRPAPGAADYAEASQRYEVAVRRLAAETEARSEDPAAWAVGSDPTLSALLQAVTTAETPEAAARAGSVYGRAVLVAQRGADIPAASQRLLPEASAQGIVAQAQAAGPDGIESLSAIMGAFAPPSGATEQVRAASRARQAMLASELIAAGADAADVAAALDLGGNLAARAAYQAARREPASLSDRQTERLNGAVATALQPFFRSFEGQDTPLFRTMRAGRIAMVRRMAASYVAEGQDINIAAARAAAPLTGSYAYVGRAGWRIPRGRADDAPLIERGVTSVMRALAHNDGARFYTPEDGPGGPNERRETYVDRVTSGGRWVTMTGDRGLVLRVRNPNGTWSDVLNAQGRPIAYTWDQLAAHGRAVGSRAIAPDGGLPPPDVGGSRPVTRASFTRWADFFIDWETAGGRTLNIANDNGRGLSRYGINQAANPDIDVSRLDRPGAVRRLQSHYWNTLRLNGVSEPLAIAAADAGAVAGVRQANRWLAEADGSLERFFSLQERHYRNLARRDPRRYGDDLRGWLNRIAAVRRLVAN